MIYLTWMRHVLLSSVTPTYEAALARDESPGERHFRLGFAREKLQDWAAAAAAYEVALARDESPGEWHFRLGFAREKLQDWAAAASAHEAALARDDRQAEWHFRLGFAREKQHDWAGAAAAYEAALARDDRQAEWHARLGFVLLGFREWAAAASAYEAALARDPSPREWYFFLGFARHKTSNWASAATAYLRALDMNPGDDLCRYRAALCLYKQGEQGRAYRLMWPIFTTNDKWGRLSFKGYLAEALFVRGLNTRSARRLTIKSKLRYETYFEYTTTNRMTFERVNRFYCFLHRKYGTSAPSFVPRLWRHYWFDGCGYLIFDYVEQAHTPPIEKLWENASLSMRFVDYLVQIRDEFHNCGGGVALGGGYPFSVCSLDAHVCNQMKKCEDSELLAALNTFRRNVATHFQNYSKFPWTFSHGDLHDGNVLVTDDGQTYIVDWECYGWAPIGLDLVQFFQQKWETLEFELLIDRYFDGAVQVADKRYAAALMTIFWSVVRNEPFSSKWLHCANNAISK